MTYQGSHTAIKGGGERRKGEIPVNDNGKTSDQKAKRIH